MLIKTTNSDFVRDTKNKALLMDNKKEANEYLNRNRLDKRITKLESSMEEIKNLLKEILNK